MSASEVESEGLGNFFWCPWEFGFNRMQHPSSILPWWLCTVIHIKTLPVSSEKCSAHPSKWKCISITAALFLPLHSICVCHSIHLDWLSSSAPLDLQLIFIKTKLLTLLIHATLEVELATRVLPEPWFASLHENTWNQYFYFGFKAIFLWPYRCFWVQACKVSPKIKSFYTLSALHHLGNLEKQKQNWNVSHLLPPWPRIIGIVWYKRSVSKINSFYTAFDSVLPSDIFPLLIVSLKGQECLVFHVIPVCLHFHWI